MPAVWLWFRADLSARWRAWLGLALVVGLASGAVMALAAGARRTDSAYSRFLRTQNAYDVAIVNYPDDPTAVFDFDEIEALPLVADSARGSVEYYTFDAINIASEDGRIGTDINGFKILDGRRAEPDDPAEIVVGFALAEKEGLEVGDTVEFPPPELVEYVRAPDTVPFPYPDALDEISPEQLLNEIAGVRRVLEEIPTARLRIVGIEASPGEFPPQFARNRALVHMTPAFHRLVDEEENEGLMVRLRGGSATVDDFLAELEERSAGRPPQVVVQRDHAAAVERSIHFQAFALWLLAALTALAAGLILAQLLARLAFVESADHPTLRALGMSPGDRLLLGVLRNLVIGATGALVGVASALLCSRFFPTGLARTAEPTPGFHVDVVVVLLGLILTVGVVGALGLWPAWRATRRGVPAFERPERARPSRIARVLSTRGAPASAAVGVRLALEPGRGTGAVPVRTTIAGVTVGIAAIVGALTFGASLAYLRDSPRLYGQTWDLEVSGIERDDVGVARKVLRDDPRVTAFSGGIAGAPFEIDGQRVGAFAMKSIEGDVTLPILEGRAPAASDEIALGARTLGAVGVDVGDDTVDVRVAGTGARARRMRVVGVAVFPTVSETAKLGEGALVAPPAVAALDPAAVDDFVDELFVRLEPGADPDTVLADLNDHLDEDAYRFDQGAPTDIVNFGRVESMPLLLGGVLAAISAATLAHLLLSAVRRRRRELAIIKTLGFVRRQVAASVAVQATTVVAIALAVALPVGIALGRVSWAVMANSLGVVSRPEVPWGALGAVVGTALLLANVIAWFPGRLAARTPAATDLRAE